MKWLNKLFKTSASKEQKGISLKNPKWEVSPTREAQSFLIALNDLLPEGSILYFEDGTPDEEIRSFFDSRKVPNPINITRGSYGKPVCYHLPFTQRNLIDLAEIMGRHAEPELATHFHVYKNNKVLLQWYDAFDDPIYLSGDIDEIKIKQFCEKLSLKYKLITYKR